MTTPPLVLGLRTVIYRAPDLAKSKAWYSTVLGVAPYFDEPFYVGFNVGGYELGLDPNGEGSGGGVTAYWGVEKLDAALERTIAIIGGEPCANLLVRQPLQLSSLGTHPSALRR